MQQMQERQVRFLGRDDPLEQEMATHSRILAWRIPWREAPGGLQSMGSQSVRQDVSLLLRQSSENLISLCAQLV